MQNITRNGVFVVLCVSIVGAIYFASQFLAAPSRLQEIDVVQAPAVPASPARISGPAVRAADVDRNAEGGIKSIKPNLKEELEKHRNYRALLHEMLRNGDRQSLVIAVGAMNRCAGFPINPKLYPEDRLNQLNERVARRWKELVAACEASGGIDRQQRNAVQEMVRAKFPDLTYKVGSVEGGSSEREVIDSISDSDGAASWLALNLERKKIKMSLMDGKPAPLHLASSAIDAEVSTLTSADTDFAIVTWCGLQKNLCAFSSFEEQMDYNMMQDRKVPESEWRNLRAQARKILREHFPKMTMQLSH